MSEIMHMDSVKSSDLKIGDIVRDHGMRVRLDTLKTWQSGDETVYTFTGTVLNLPEVWEVGFVPRSFLRTERFDESARRWVTDREDVWVVQGNGRVYWPVERPAAGKAA